MTSSAPAADPALPAVLTVPLPRRSADGPLGWVDPADLERRLEAHLLIARRINGGTVL